MVGNVRVELTSYPYQGYVLTVILISYGERNLVLTSSAVTQLCYWDHGKSCTYHYLLRRPYGDPRGTRTLKYQRERLMTVSCSSMGP